MIETIRIESIEELIRHLNDLPCSFFYRGHASAAWKLESSLERVIGSSWTELHARLFEDRSLAVFESKFHLYDVENIQPASKLAWMSAMQHYGVPTRFLDFTESPYVALYFALEAYSPSCPGDLAVFAIDYSALMDQSINAIAQNEATFQETRLSIQSKQDIIFDRVIDLPFGVAWVAEPKQLNARLDRQAGSFLFSSKRELKILDVLESPVYANVRMIKFEIAFGLYPAIYALLRKMNINSKSLYGDLVGLARSIRMELQVYSVEQQS